MEHTIHFTNAREATEVLGRSAELLPHIEKALGVNLTARDVWIKVKGPDESVELVNRFISYVRDARARGIELQKHGLLYALNAFRDGQEKELKEMHEHTIQTYPTKRSIFPRTLGQKEYVQAIKKHDICFGVGPAGTGKTYLAMALAVAHLIDKRVNRIILTRPAVEAGEALGFLPGDMHQKVQPYLKPLYDALHDMMEPDTIEQYMERGVIEVAPLAYMRGRTLNNSFIILDEAQNTTSEQMMMFLTRMGFESKCVITGDPTQIDLPSAKRSGLGEVIEILKDIQDIGIIHLDEKDVVRHELVQKIIKAYRRSRDRQQKQRTVTTG